jgi:ring-1,2-phenylacetyl-CoA epoxidase subunit PaaD
VNPPESRDPAVEQVFQVLREVKDPEVPVLDVVELGIIRGVELEDGRVTVSVTPTYSGCPAMAVIEHDIEAALRRHGYTEIAVKTVFTPPWTTDWIGAEAREKLREYGIAPPGPAAEAVQLVALGGPPRPVSCPYCGSANTTRESEFGSTACKSIHVCHDCRQPFEQFKAI